jgi:hypothetical protein
LQKSVDERLGRMRADELKVRQGIAPEDQEAVFEERRGSGLDVHVPLPLRGA